VSTTDVDLIGSPVADDLYNPEFAVVLRGYDPEEVRAYVQNVATHIDGLQRQLQDANEQVEAGRRQYMAAKEAAYKQLATHMADLLHAADMEAERLKREGQEEASHATSEAERVSLDMRREAESHAETLRREGEEMLWRAKSETERTLGGLTAKREEMLKELEATRGRLRSVMASLESTIDATRDETRRGAEAAAAVSAQAHAESVSEPLTELEPLAAAVMDDAEAEPQDPQAHDPAPSMEDEPAVEERGFSAGSANGMSAGLGDHEYEATAPAHLEGADDWDAPAVEPGTTEQLAGTEESFDLVLPDLRIDEEGEIEDR
jgi:DivIVA domain-containing protein